MMTIAPSALSEMSDKDLIARLQLAAHAERQATAHLISLLMELETRRLYLGEGFSSLFMYCTQALHLSEHAAYNRIETARAARRFPIILELIGEGTATLTAIRLLAPHLTPGNHREVLTRACHKSKREVEQLVATLHPQPDVSPMIRKLPTPTAVKTPAPAPTAADTTSGANVEAPMATPLPRDMRPMGPVEVKPLAPERYKIQFTVGREVYEKFRRAQDLLRHVVPNGDPAIVFERALTLLVVALERRKTAMAVRPRDARAAKRASRHIPAAVNAPSGSATAGDVLSRGGRGDAPKPVFSSTTMWCHSLRAARQQPPILNCVVVHTTATKPISTLAWRKCRCYANAPRCTNPELVPERVLRCSRGPIALITLAGPQARSVDSTMSGGTRDVCMSSSSIET